MRVCVNVCQCWRWVLHANFIFDSWNSITSTGSKQQQPQDLFQNFHTFHSNDWALTTAACFQAIGENGNVCYCQKLIITILRWKAVFDENAERKKRNRKTQTMHRAHHQSIKIYNISTIKGGSLVRVSHQRRHYLETNKRTHFQCLPNWLDDARVCVCVCYTLSSTHFLFITCVTATSHVVHECVHFRVIGGLNRRAHQRQQRQKCLNFNFCKWFHRRVSEEIMNGNGSLVFGLG